MIYYPSIDQKPAGIQEVTDADNSKIRLQPLQRLIYCLLQILDIKCRHFPILITQNEPSQRHNDFILAYFVNPVFIIKIDQSTIFYPMLFLEVKIIL